MTHLKLTQKNTMKIGDTFFDLFTFLILLCLALFIPLFSDEVRSSETRTRLWSGVEPLPTLDKMETLKNVEFVRIKERAPSIDRLSWQHGGALIRFGKDFYFSVGVNSGLENTVGEKILMIKSSNGCNKGGSSLLLEPNDTQHGRSHGVFLEISGELWALHSKFVAAGKGPGQMFPGLAMEAFHLNSVSGSWENRGEVAHGIWPLHEPIRLTDGRLIVAGCDENWRGSVAISEPNDPLHWQTVKVNAPNKCYTEGNLWYDGKELTLLLRNETPQQPGTIYAAVSFSSDNGRTWSVPVESNLPMNMSKPACFQLSNGSRCLIGLTASDNRGRHALTIAVGRPNQATLSRVWKIRDIKATTPPNAFDASSFSYPHAAEYDGKLYVIYSVGDRKGKRGNHNHIEMAVIPLNEVTGF